MSTVIDANGLRLLRKARQWDQQTLARNAGIDPSVVSRLERGLQADVNASVLVAVAHALNVTVDSLLTHEKGSDDFAPIPELASVVTELTNLSEGQQRQVTAILRAYLSTLPETS